MQDFDTRVVVVASAGHAVTDHWQGVDLTDIHFQHGRSYGKLIAYGQSKSANIMFAKADCCTVSRFPVLLAQLLSPSTEKLLGLKGFCF